MRKQTCWAKRKAILPSNITYCTWRSCSLSKQWRLLQLQLKVASLSCSAGQYAGDSVAVKLLPIGQFFAEDSRREASLALCLQHHNIVSTLTVLGAHGGERVIELVMGMEGGGARGSMQGLRGGSSSTSSPLNGIQYLPTRIAAAVAAVCLLYCSAFSSRGIQKSWVHCGPSMGLSSVCTSCSQVFFRRPRSPHSNRAKCRIARRESLDKRTPAVPFRGKFDPSKPRECKAHI